MVVYYGYKDATLGTETTVDGSPVDYAFAPTFGGEWRWSGNIQNFSVRENDGATQYNGDPTNEFVSTQERIGQFGEQVTNIDGSWQQTIWDYTFTVSDGTTTYRIAVIDVDLNNDNDLNDAGEDGYYLIFLDGPPPADTHLTVGGIIENDDMTPHAGLGADVVCFAAGTEILTPRGPTAVEDLTVGARVLTRDGGPQPIRWHGSVRVRARGKLAPVVIAARALGNDRALVLSPQHGVLVTDWRAELYFGVPEVLVRAIDLVGRSGIARRHGGWVSYHHFLLDAHHLVSSHGLWSESLFPGEVTQNTVSDAARDEIATLFPDLPGYGPKAARCLRRFEAACLMD